MITEEKILLTRREIKEWKKADLSIGFVPTMGFLHEGHESLIEKSKSENDRTVVSIFVNPMQFNEAEDLNNYPRALKEDIDKCNALGVDLVFCPDAKEVYGDSFLTYVDMNVLTEGLCGNNRENHFRGVCTVVSKLFNIVSPDRAYFGQKDAQQLSIITKMVEDLNFDIEIIACPTVREKDGLAKSSRNVKLTREDRLKAKVIYMALQNAKEKIHGGETSSDKIKAYISSHFKDMPKAKIEYIEVVDFSTLKPVTNINSNTLMAVAIKFGEVRLIDNIIL